MLLIRFRIRRTETMFFMGPCAIWPPPQRRVFPCTSLQFPMFLFMAIAYCPIPVQPQCLCWPYTLTMDAAESREIGPPRSQGGRHPTLWTPSPMLYAPALPFCHQNTIPDRYFCGPSVKVAFNPERHTATERGDHNVLPPSSQTAGNDDRFWHTKCQLTLGELELSFGQLKGSKCFQYSSTSLRPSPWQKTAARMQSLCSAGSACLW